MMKKFCRTKAYDEEGNLYLDLTIPKEGKSTEFDVRSDLYTIKDNQVLQSETCFKGSFNMNKYMKLLFKKNVQPDQEYLKLGTGSICRGSKKT